MTNSPQKCFINEIANDFKERVYDYTLVILKHIALKEKLLINELLSEIEKRRAGNTNICTAVSVFVMAYLDELELTDKDKILTAVQADFQQLLAQQLVGAA